MLRNKSWYSNKMALQSVSLSTYSTQVRWRGFLLADGDHDFSQQVKGAGLPDTREICWKFFIDRVRKQLKVVLCFSPVGSTLRVRSRKFPALINCTSINWFHEWPQEALVSVSMRFLEELLVLPVSYRKYFVVLINSTDYLI